MEHTVANTPKSNRCDVKIKIYTTSKTFFIYQILFTNPFRNLKFQSFETIHDYVPWQDSNGAFV